MLLFDQISSLTKSEQDDIEKATRGQASNKLWFSNRAMRVTSSHFGTICKATDRRDMAKCCQDIVSPCGVTCKAMEHGKKYERVAVEKYEQLHGVSTHECGLFVSTDEPYLAASPDRLLADDVVVEVKCPFTNKDKMITPQTVPYLQSLDGVLMLKQGHDYHYQIQGQLYCTGRAEGHLVVFSLKDTQIVTVPRDDKFIA